MNFTRIHTSLLILAVLVLALGFTGCKSGGMSAQEGGGLSWKNKLKIADKFYKEGYFYDACHYYSEVLEEQPDNMDVTYKLAESYYLSRDYKEANENYKMVMDKNLVLYPMSHYKYALTLKMTGRYPEAKEEFAKFGKSYKGADANLQKKRVKNEILGCDYALEALGKPLNVVVIHMGNEINAAYTEASPMPVGADKLIYASLRSDTVIAFEDVKSRVGRFQLYQSVKTYNRWSQGELLPPEVNEPGMDVANGCYSPDKKRFFYTQCKSDKTGKMICSIFMSDFIDGKWKKAKKLDDKINMEGYTNTHPTVGKYKKGAQILYFVSDRPGAGGKDIWYSEISKDGVFKDPKNLGKKINTISDELTPFYNNESRVLYFSSNGHPGIGGYDAFSTEGRLRKWTKPENVGYPLNSSVDDMYFVADEDETGGYLISNRPGVIALKSETCCDDIFRYSWDTDLIPKFYLEGFAYDFDDSTTTTFMDYDVKLYQIDADSSEILINEAHIVDEPLFRFKLKRDRNYKVLCSKNGYYPNDALASTMGLKKTTTLHREIPLKKLELNKTIVLKDIYYDFDKATLRDESTMELEKLVDILNVNPTIIVELGAHTDSKGNNLYNKKLSQRRAESVVKYLKKAGISKERLVAKGYGETQFIAENTNEDGSDNPEGRQMNRRTEIKVIGKTEIEVKKKKATLEDAQKDAEGE